MSFRNLCRSYPLLLGGILAVLAGCRDGDDDLAWWQSERQRIELSQHLKLLEYRLAERGGEKAANLATANAAIAANQRTLAPLRQRADELRREIDALQQKTADAAQHAMRERRATALGQHFDSLKLTSGKSFEDVTVQNIGDSGVSIHHAHGAARLRFADLSAEQQAFFGLTEATALAAEREESEAAAAYEHALVLDQNLAAQTRTNHRTPASTHQRRSRRTQPSAIANHTDRQRPLAQNAKPVGSSSSFRVWRYRSSPRNYYYYTPVYRSNRPVFRDALPAPKPAPQPRPSPKPPDGNTPSGKSP